MCKDAKVDDTESKQKILLTEYQAAQSSAEHHDRLAWTVTSIVWAGSLVLMGSILKTPKTDCLDFLSIVLCVLGFCLLWFVWDTQRPYNRIMNQKYARCKEIEQRLGMNHHLATEWPKNLMTFEYGVIMVVFLLAWLFVAVSVFWR